MNPRNVVSEEPLSHDPREWQPGSILAGRYEIEGFLAEGGMGVVLRARHKGLNQPVAIKLLTVSARQSPELVARFLRESRAVVGLSGEHTVRVIDVGSIDDGTPYIVMERLEGRDLRDELTASGPMPVEVAVDFVLQACLAIAEAHGAGIVHRDIKPSNLFLTRRADGTALIKVLDFGISKFNGPDSENVELTTTRTVLGSPQYMSPEQIRSPKKTDPRTDIWALGIVLHELLAGSPPFVGETVPELSAAIAADQPTTLRSSRPDAPGGLEAVILRCLEKPVDARYGTVAELARALAPFSPFDGNRLAVRVERVCDPSLSSEATIGSERVHGTTAIGGSAPRVAVAAGARVSVTSDDGAAPLSGTLVAPPPSEPVAEAVGASPRKRQLFWLAIPLALLAALGAVAGWWADSDDTPRAPSDNETKVATPADTDNERAHDVGAGVNVVADTDAGALGDAGAAGEADAGAVAEEGDAETSTHAKQGQATHRKPRGDKTGAPVAPPRPATTGPESTSAEKQDARPDARRRKDEVDRDPLEDRR